MSEKLSSINTAEAFLEALQESGVSYLFSNLGSDHPSIIEALAKAKASNKELPQVIISPHEYVALSAAHGYYMATGEAQGVFVHTDVGTQNLGGSIHNALRSQIPVFIFSGETPYTMKGELYGSRNSPINYLQNVYDQRGIVRNYVKWEGDIRTGENVKQLVYRALQIANSNPKGPVYLTGAREVLAEDVQVVQEQLNYWKPISPSPLPQEAVELIVNSLAHAKAPLIITSAVGRNEESFHLLVEFCEKLAVPVVEVNTSYVSFKGNHPMHLGYDAGDLVDKSDVILVMDSDVPWIPSIKQPKETAKVFYIDTDPLKTRIPLWHIPAEALYQADSHQALSQFIEYVEQMNLSKLEISTRYEKIKNMHEEQRQKWKEEAFSTTNDVISADFLSACIQEVIDEDTIILNETITNSMSVMKHLPRTKPKTLLGNGGSSLGWNGGAALGVKLAHPDKTVVSLTGDGSYLFSVPSSVHWMSRRYNAPFLTVIYNNQGWNATKNNLLKLYPDGVAKRDDRYWVNFDQPSELDKIAEAAGGALALSVSHPDEVKTALKKGIEAVVSGRSAVIDVKLQVISEQKD